ncbi:restriction endonuclease subunit S [Gemella sp. 20925_1_85]|uniref:restriction endonuclease subunit S n=1 Tax=Gemella sp. 20925_1_85 TaxID=3003690 RepID=UPI00352E6253
MKKITFDNFVRLSRGFDLPERKIVDGEYPVVASTNIKAYHNAYKVNPPVVVTGRSGSLGKVQYIDSKCWPLNTSLYSKDFRGNIPKYIYFFLQTMHLEQYNAGAGVPTLNQNHLQRLKIVVHDIDEQKKVADILSTYDNLIENNNKRIKLLEQMAENLYKEWFVRFRFPGYEDVEFEEKKPRGWQVSNEEKKHYAPSIFKYDEFGKIGSFARGKNITVAKMIEGDIPVISAGLQPSGYHNEANVYGTSLTISASGANAGYLQYHMNDIWAADCSYYQDDTKIWFLYNTLKYLQPVISNLQCGAAQPHVYPKNINKLFVLIPTEELIYKYNDFVKTYYEEIKILNQHNQILTKQRDMLLPRLMSGKLKV